ncbi:MAG: hypothetical protein R3C19_26705 [Planctomycetaceae bacterium]
MSDISSATLAALGRCDTPTVCNAIELFSVRPRSSGYMNRSIQACFPKLPPMVGFALTSTFRALSPPRGGDAYAGMEGQLEAFEKSPGPPVIVFQDLDEPSAAATFGEVMCTTYKAFGAAGLITSGTGRDLDQVEVLEFPAFTSGTCCSHGSCHILSVNVAVVVGGITIYPGDLLHGDCNGITTIPPEIASEVPDACAELADAEKIVLDYVRGGQPTVSISGSSCGNDSGICQTGQPSAKVGRSSGSAFRRPLHRPLPRDSSTEPARSASETNREIFNMKRLLLLPAICLIVAVVLSRLDQTEPIARASAPNAVVPAEAEVVEDSMHEFMEYVFQPTYRRLKASMAEEPKDNNGWKAVKSDSLILAESCNLLFARTPKEHGDDWNNHAAESRTGGAALYAAAKDKDFAKATASYKAMLESCNACHRQFENGKHILQP